MTKKLTPLQQNTKDENDLYTIIHNIGFDFEVMCDMPEYPKEIVEKKIDQLEKCYSKMIKLHKERLAMIKRP